MHRLNSVVTLITTGAFRIGGGLGLIDPILAGTGRGRGRGNILRQRSGRAVAVLERGLGSTKHQAPSTKEAPSTKHQRADAHEPHLWSLKFGASLELGAWSLELHQYVSVMVKIPL